MISRYADAATKNVGIGEWRFSCEETEVDLPTSFIAPDPVGEAHLIKPPSGPEIEALGKRILAMQNGESA